jgi:hypothetical protein
MVFANINQTQPVRTTAKGSGLASMSSVAIASAPGDLVECVVAHGGNGINGPGVGQTLVFLDNNSGGNTLDNAAGSMAPGAAMVTMTWTMASNDDWQQLEASLQP